MFVRSFMSSPVVTLPSSTRAIDAMELMQARKIRRIPVKDESDRLTGILTMGDLQAVLGLQENSARRAATLLGDIMTRRVHTVAPDDPLERAARMMLDHEVSGLPVLHGEKIVGIITESDIFLAFTRIMGIVERGVRVVLTIPEGVDLMDHLSRRVAGMRVRSLAAYPSREGGWEAVVRVRGRSLARLPGHAT
ncbi:MAG TPA: CBS domain-containing protein [Planctomycetota bacterium]|jgi:acetoin utilization protein AcuB|nr:CBS domain-containing protein [Planctomycetota bacterium]